MALYFIEQELNGSHNFVCTIFISIRCLTLSLLSQKLTTGSSNEVDGERVLSVTMTVTRRLVSMRAFDATVTNCHGMSLRPEE